MAGLVSAGSLAEPDEFNYSVSHRSPPVPTATCPTPPTHDKKVDREEVASVSSVFAERKRRGSLSFLRRSSNPPRGIAGEQEQAPPLPATRIVQAHLDAAAAGGTTPATHASGPASTDYSVCRASPPSQPPPSRPPTQPPKRLRSNRRRKSSSDGSRGGFSMLRKSSRMKKEEQERVARENAPVAAHALPKQPPRLQSIHLLPNIGSFAADADDDNDDTANRSDSYAIFSQTSPGADPPTQPAQAAPRATANFSRPVATPPHYANMQSSSSPAYAIRSGNAFAQAVSSSPSWAGAAPSANGEYRYERAESMTNRGRYSYASSTATHVNMNSPRRVRRRKDPTPFNILVVGAKNSGKTSFISFLRHSLALPAHKQSNAPDKDGDSQVNGPRSSFASHYVESEMDGERIGVTLWDSAGLEKHIIDLQLREMASFVEAKFEETFVEEQKVVRSPGFRDTHIHCAFLVLDPVRLDATTASQRTVGLVKGGLDDGLDLQVLRSLWGKTTVIPVISKADTLTVGHMSFLKRAVWDSLKTAKLDPLEALDLEGDEDQDSDTLPEEEEEDEEDAHKAHRVVNNLADDSDDSEYKSEDETPLVKSRRTNGHNRQASMVGPIATAAGDELPYLPMSILSPDLYDLPPYAKTSENAKVGRRFPWGFADPYDPEHCDFTRLKDSIFSEWRGDLRDLSRTKWYENWRTSRLNNLPGSKQRVRGGVTPVAAVPKEGRMLTPTNMRREANGVTSAPSQANVSVPRSASGSTAVASQHGSIGMAVAGPSPSKAERMLGMGPKPSSMSFRSRGGVTMQAQ